MLQDKKILNITKYDRNLLTTQSGTKSEIFVYEHIYKKVNGMIQVLKPW